MALPERLNTGPRRRGIARLRLIEIGEKSGDGVEQFLLLVLEVLDARSRAQRRRAQNKVNALSRSLSHVHFGTVRRIELKVKPVRRMNELLAALAGEADLFRDTVPIEQALEEAFESIGGGKVKASRLLDYRSYFQVKVLVEKSDGESAGARGDQMSTGEAIGVGAAIMMIVLQAWEDESAKLRKKRDFGNLRLLFLDEATRLSRESLVVLFDLCRELELQLLISCPDRHVGSHCCFDIESLLRAESVVVVIK